MAAAAAGRTSDSGAADDVGSGGGAACRERLSSLRRPAAHGSALQPISARIAPLASQLNPGRPAAAAAAAAAAAERRYASCCPAALSRPARAPHSPARPQTGPARPPAPGADSPRCYTSRGQIRGADHVARATCHSRIHIDRLCSSDPPDRHTCDYITVRVHE